MKRELQDRPRAALAALLAGLGLAACSGPEPPAERAEPPPPVLHLADRPEDVVRVEGTIAEFLGPPRLDLRLETRASPAGPSVLSLPWPPIPDTLELRRDDETEPLHRGTPEELAAGTADYAWIPARRRVPVQETVRRGGRLEPPDLELDAAPPGHGTADDEPTRFVLAGGEGALEYVFPALVAEHVLAVRARARPTEDRSAVPRAAVVLRGGGAELARAELALDGEWRTLRLPLRLEPGLARLRLVAETSGAEVDVTWVELQQAERDLLVWGGAPGARLAVRYVPARVPAGTVVHSGADGLLYSLAADGPLVLLPVDGGDPLEVDAAECDDPALLAVRPTGGAGWARLARAGGRARLAVAANPPLWREDRPSPPDDPLVALALARTRLGGDRRPGFWLPAGSRLDLRAELHSGDRLRFAVGRPETPGAERDSAGEAPERAPTFRVTWTPDGGEARTLDELVPPLSAGDGAERWLEREVSIDEDGAGVLRWEVIGAAPVSAAFADPRLVRASAAEDPRPNLVVYLIDTLRADHLSCYGGRNPTSPRLDRLAQEGFRFERFHAVAPWTRPTTATVLTGYYPSWHGMGRELPLPYGLETMAETLARRGWSTWAAVANPQVGGSTLQFSQGFHRFVDSTGIGAPGDGPRPATSRQLNSTALPWLEALGDEPFFLYLHSLDPHTPYAPPPDAESPFGRDYRGPMFQESLRRKQLLESADRIGEEDRRYVEDMYDNEIRYQDRQIGVLLDELERLGLLDETVVTALSDHGEEFLDHGDWNHGYRMWEEQLRVPLILWLPPALRERIGVEPRVVPESVSQVDFLPGLFDLLGLRDDFPRQGRSWLPLLAGGEADLLPYFGEDWQTWEGDEIGAFRRGPLKLIWTRYEDEDREEARLYDLESDPRETRDLAGEHPDLVRDLQTARDALAVFVARVRERLVASGREYVLPASGDAEPARLTEAEQRELEALGYVQEGE